MKKALAVLGLLFGFTVLSYAGTPQDVFFPSQLPLSGSTILTSSATTIGGTFTLTVATPSVINSGGTTFTGRNCFTRILLQVSSATTVTIADNLTTKWTVYGADLGVALPNTLNITEDHLGPFCTAAGDQTVFTATGAGSLGFSEVIDVEGYTEYPGVVNQGNMY